MSSQHRLRPRSFRPEPGEYAVAQAVLDARGRHMDAFLRACLRSLHADPDGFLALLAPLWPTPKPQGRPSQQAPADPGDPGRQGRTGRSGASAATGRAGNRSTRA